MDISVVERGYLDLPEEVQAVGCLSRADRLEVRGCEGGEIVIGELFGGAEVLGFML